MSLLGYLGGVLLLLVAGTSAGWTGYRLRARLLPGWSGAPARLVEVVTAIGLVTVLAELLGLFGLIRAWTLVPALLLIVLFAWLRLNPVPAGPENSRPPSPPVPGSAWLLGLTVVFLLVAQWGAFVAQNLDAGITNFDSVWYHMPFAAEIARTGSVTTFFHTETVFANWFYPQNSELLHGLLIVLSDRDFFSVFLNLGWLGLALLGGWCIGRPFGRPHLTLIAVAVLLASHTLVVREAGTGKNDIVAIALTVSTVAILINRSSSTKSGFGRIGPGWALAAAGLAAGLAVGTKVTALAPAAMITAATVVAAAHGRRWRSLGIWFAAGLLGGGWWYLRNLLATGNPLPQVKSLGPLSLPGPELFQQGRPDFSVFHYLTDGAVWRDYFLPGLERGLGLFWPVLLVLVVVGTVAVALRGPGRLTRAHGVAALFAILAYIVTPLTAAGPEGHPTAFAINLRFVIPALAMGIALVPLLPWFERGWGRRVIAALLVTLFLVTWAEHPALPSTSGSAFGVALALLVVALPATAWRLRERLNYGTLRKLLRGRSPFAVACLSAAAVFLFVGWPLTGTYFDSRYRDFEPAAGLAAPYGWVRETGGARIGLAGSTAGFKQYGFFGPDLSNRVIYIGKPSGSGGFDAIGNCAGFLRAVNAARLDYLVTSPFLNFNQYDRPLASPERDWIRGDPALSPLVADGPVTVWRVDGRLDPARCARLSSEKNFTPGLRADQ